MKAELDHDIIVNWTSRADATEVGTPPPGVGLERLRWNGTAIVDLAELQILHVTCKNNVFTLHAIHVPGAQQVTMTYNERKNLINEYGIYRVKTASEIQLEEIAAENAQLKANLRLGLNKALGDTPDQIADISKMVILLLVAQSGGAGATEAQAAVVALAPKYANIYPTDVVLPHLEQNADILALAMPDYYEDRQ